MVGVQHDKPAHNGYTPALDPVVYALQIHIESDAELMQLFAQAFREIPDRFQDVPDEDGHPRIHDYRSMINAIDRAIRKAPVWYSSLDSECVIGCAINESLVCGDQLRKDPSAMANI
jgi:hypothetical protein